MGGGSPSPPKPPPPLPKALPPVRADDKRVSGARTRERSIARLRAGRSETILSDFMANNTIESPQGKTLLGT